VNIRSFVAWVPRGDRDEAAPAAPRGADPRQWRSWRHEALTVWYAPRAASAPLEPHGVLPDLVLGDASEWSPGRADATLAGGVPLAFDAGSRSLVVHTSIVALPPVFLYRGAHATALTSDIALLAGLPGIRLEFDPRGVTELGWFGHPVDHRTLFRDVELVAAGGRLTIGPRGEAAFAKVWRLPERSPVPAPEFLEAQIAAFTAAVARIDVRSSFLSLTAGLDTRTVLAVLASEHRGVPGVTMTGARPSLDARTAKTLCRAYGLPHRPVVLDDGFRKNLPRLTEDASRLSGGLASLGQAPEVFLYDQLDGAFSARLSGNLGNQVGRGGTEGVSLRGAELGILGAPFRAELAPGDHWLLRAMDQGSRQALDFILEKEIAFSSVGNYSIGNHFAAQQSPYASRALVETLAARPANGHHSGSKLQMRLRDMKHRFLGEPERVSFQRTLVARIGGPAAHIPVNWGWRPTGGLSLPGLALGAATFVGMAARAKGLDDGRGPAGALVRWTGLPALHDFRESRRWLRETLRDFVLDVVRSGAVRDAGIFHQPRLERVLEEYFSGGNQHYETVTFALDLALAHRLTAGAGR
jgi:hypothetical protein